MDKAEARMNAYWKAAKKVSDDIDGGRKLYALGVPRDEMRSDGMRIGWDEAAYDFEQKAKTPSVSGICGGFLHVRPKDESSPTCEALLAGLLELARQVGQPQTRAVLAAMEAKK